VYLFAYNTVSALGWLFVLYITVQSLLEGKAPKDFWAQVATPLRYVQTAAFLEVLHALFGLVGSSPIATIMQVGSRLGLLWVFSNNYSEAQAHWSLYLMVGSWALVEVPRYAFYAVNIFVDKVPFPLFWARYTLFMVLYPSGITGEITQIFTSLPAVKGTSLVLFYLSLFALLLYVPGSPFMYFHMVGQRKGAFLKRKTAGTPPPPAAGIEFPLDTRTNERSTTNVNKGAFEAAMRVVKPEEADRIKREKNWRYGYHKHVINHVRVLAGESPEKCIDACKAGLQYLHDSFEFIRDGKTMKLSEAMATINGSFATGFVKGTKPKPEKYDYVVEYSKFPDTGAGKKLRGDELKAQLKLWASRGTIEQDCADQITSVIDHPEWQDLSQYYFVLLGAGSAMGPLITLLEHGANIIAIDIDRKPVWERLIKLAKESCGSMYFPLKREGLTEDQWADNAGCNLFTQTPEVCNWVKQVGQGKDLVVGGYAYLDGALHVKVALAMDAVMEGVIKSRKGNERSVTLAFLCTPTDVHLIPQDAYNGAQANYSKRPLYQRLLELLPLGQLKKNVLPPVKASNGSTLYMVDGIVVPQGPNYALAKRMQHWRAMVSWSQGVQVSSNVAPSTATKSVVHNKQFAAAYQGFKYFRPMEIMYQETSNAVMGALLIHDVRAPNAKTKKQMSQFTNPQELFSIGGFHGGVWRSAYNINSFGTYAAVFYYAKTYSVHLIGGLAVVGGAVFQMIRNPPHLWF